MNNFNGWANWETRNVALWLQNDIDLYNLAKATGNYKDLVEVLYNDYGVRETSDGAKFNDPKLDVDSLNEMIKEL